MSCVTLFWRLLIFSLTLDALAILLHVFYALQLSFEAMLHCAQSVDFDTIFTCIRAAWLVYTFMKCPYQNERRVLAERGNEGSVYRIRLPTS